WTPRRPSGRSGEPRGTPPPLRGRRRRRCRVWWPWRAYGPARREGEDRLMLGRGQKAPPPRPDATFSSPCNGEVDRRRSRRDGGAAWLCCRKAPPPLGGPPPHGWGGESMVRLGRRA